MKKLLTLVLTLALLSIQSCKKDEEMPAAVKDKFTARIDALSWSANSYQASIYNGSIVVIGESSDGTTITISIDGDTAGLYGMSSSTGSTAILSLPSGKGFSTAASPDAGGQILIESINAGTREMTGTFNFTAVRASDDSTISVTEGRFVNLKYSNLPIGVENNRLSVDVNGSNWSPVNVSGFVAFKTLFINAIDADGTRTLSFELPFDIAPGTYTLNYFTPYKALYISPDGRTHYAVKGDLEVTSHNLVNQEIKANFNTYLKEYEGTGEVHLTDGYFEINYE